MSHIHEDAKHAQFGCLKSRRKSTKNSVANYLGRKAIFRQITAYKRLTGAQMVNVKVAPNLRQDRRHRGLLRFTDERGNGYESPSSNHSSLSYVSPVEYCCSVQVFSCTRGLSVGYALPG
jgi:hypothetical protein